MLLTDNELEELKASMSNQQVVFCYEYVKHFNGTEAAKVAGYSPNAPHSQASRLLNYATVQKLLNHLKLARLKRIEVSGDRIVQELAKIAFQDTADFIDHDGIGNVMIKSFENMGDNSRVVKTIKTAQGGVTELVLHDKMKALELLGRHCALFTDNMNHTSNGGDMPASQTIVNIQINHRKPGDKLKK